MDVVRHSKGNVKSGGGRGRVESSGTMQLLDRLGHGLVSPSILSDDRRGVGARSEEDDPDGGELKEGPPAESPASHSSSGKNCPPVPGV